MEIFSPNTFISRLFNHPLPKNLIFTNYKDIDVLLNKNFKDLVKLANQNLNPYFIL